MRWLLFAQASSTTIQLPGNWSDYLDKGAVVALLMTIIVTGMRQVWVWGYLYREVKKERDEYKELVLKALGTGERAIKRLED